jgi:2'-5' RNA ligase
MGARLVVYWLIPAEPAREFFQRTIRQLSVRFGAAEFEPHLTVFPEQVNRRSPNEVLCSLESPRINLDSRGIGESDEFTKTLFVQFERNSSLQRLADRIRELSGADQPYLVNPHLSLLYQKIPAETRRALIQTIQLPFREVRFDTICAMLCKSPTETASDVREWKLLARQNSTIRKGE